MSHTARVVVAVIFVCLLLAAYGVLRLPGAIARRDAQRTVHAEAHRLARLP